ncbi:MAG: zinc ABC transporter substrate-binding protein [bacterium]
MSIKKVTLSIICGVIFIGCGAYFWKQSPQQKIILQKKIKVVTTLYPLYNFTKEIGKNLVDVTLLIPPGVEPHSFEPTPRDMIILNEADLFIYTGPLMETWAENVIKGVSNNRLIVVNTSKSVRLIPAVFHDLGEKQGALDPHIWLGLNNDHKIIDEITNGLIQADKKNSSFYRKNAQEYQNEITALEAKYKEGLTTCRNRTVVYGGHYTFGYLARQYNLTYLAAAGISSDAEPTASDLKRLVETVKREHVSTIFYQELSSPKVAETIAEESGTQMLLLNGAHTISKHDFERGVSFIEIMKNNLHNLRKGLGCI